MIGKCGLVKCACGRLADKTDTDLSRGNTPVPTTQVLPFPSYLHIDVLITGKLLYANIVLLKFTPAGLQLLIWLTAQLTSSLYKVSQVENQNSRHKFFGDRNELLPRIMKR
jgi:hypothetical protein